MSDDMNNSEGQAGPSRQSRLRSEIAFPYTSMEEALTIIQAMNKAGGVPLTRDQLIAYANVGNSVFVGRLSSAILFGLIQKGDKSFSMTALAERLLSPVGDIAAQARVDALLSPELYRKVIDHFRGKLLPGREGLENAMESFGVSPRQKERARQVFERSALFAGFFSAGKDRLVQPLIIVAEPVTSRFDVSQVSVAVEPVTKATDEPLIAGLLARMPTSDKDWPVAERVRWMRALAVNLAFVYGDESEGDWTIEAPSKAGALLQRVKRMDEQSAAKAPVSAKSGPKQAPSGWDVDQGASDLDDEIPF